MRHAVTLSLDGRTPLHRPAIPVQRLTLRPRPGMAPLEALIGTPTDSRGVLVYFPGFNTPLGEWEVAKCQFLAEATSLTVVMTEIPGMSRYRDPIPSAIRRDMLRRRIDTWAELNLAYFAEAFRAGGVTNTETMQVLGYSTGCSLATAALGQLAQWGPIEGLNLVEPVAIVQRSLASLQADNLADWGRLPWVHATNRHHDWVVATRRRQLREPSVHYSAVDLLAIAQVLSSEGLLAELERVDLAHCAIARGERSSLCRRSDFEKLDAMLAERGIPGPSITIPKLGHQLWHSFPTLVELATAMLATAGPSR
ncbi:MAG: hypothetical protein KIT69_10320 [Propionibacteriaceae bacterium]|nr:hypothetical protein [Propionibacteriaceae bacterium]